MGHGLLESRYRGGKEAGEVVGFFLQKYALKRSWWLFALRCACAFLLGEVSVYREQDACV